MLHATVHAEILLHDINGQTVPWSSLRGKWVFIHYWASWCHPCLEEIAALNHFYHANKKNIALFAVNYDALPKKALASQLREADIQFPSLTNESEHALQLGEISVVPVTFIFNPEGKLTNTLYGGQTSSSLNAIIHPKDASTSHRKV
jgi:thiol-disulfide isomerase/thioredoxin